MMGDERKDKRPAQAEEIEAANKELNAHHPGGEGPGPGDVVADTAVAQAPSMHADRGGGVLNETASPTPSDMTSRSGSGMPAWLIWTLIALAILIVLILLF